MFRITARLDLKLDPETLLEACGLEPGGRVQRVIDQTVIDFCQPYVPASPNRILEGSAQLATEIGSGMVVYDTPYAHFQYQGFVRTDEFGRVWVGEGEKKPILTDRPLNYDTAQNPLAGPHWVERMKADRMKEIEEVARAAAVKGRW